MSPVDETTNFSLSVFIKISTGFQANSALSCKAFAPKLVIAVSTILLYQIRQNSPPSVALFSFLGGLMNSHYETISLTQDVVL